MPYLQVDYLIHLDIPHVHVDPHVYVDIPHVYNAIKNSVEVPKTNNVPGFGSIKLINSKRQSPNRKKLLTKA